MLAEKQKIASVIDGMSEIEIKNLWMFIQNRYPTWESIPTDIPTKEERTILDSINEDDDDFISQDELLKRLGLTAFDLT